HLVPLDRQIPVHLVAVEIRAVHAGELHLAAHAQAAAAAHAGAVNHDGAHGNGGGDAVGLRGLGNKFHHHHGTDGEHLIILVASVNQLLQRLGDNALLAIGAVVGADLQYAACGP
ncbi:Lineage-specific thermal regulator protein, partial [Dysosmobacter welbionis]